MELKKLFRIRKEIEVDGHEFKRIISQKKIKEIWGEIKGEELKTSPKGFSADHQHIDLIKKKQFIFIKKLKEEEILEKNFQKKWHLFVLSGSVFHFFEILLTSSSFKSPRIVTCIIKIY